MRLLMRKHFRLGCWWCTVQTKKLKYKVTFCLFIIQIKQQLVCSLLRHLWISQHNLPCKLIKYWVLEVISVLRLSLYYDYNHLNLPGNMNWCTNWLTKERKTEIRIASCKTIAKSSLVFQRGWNNIQ